MCYLSLVIIPSQTYGALYTPPYGLSSPPHSNQDSPMKPLCHHLVINKSKGMKSPLTILSKSSAKGMSSEELEVCPGRWLGLFTHLHMLLSLYKIRRKRKLMCVCVCFLCCSHNLHEKERAEYFSVYKGSNKKKVVAPHYQMY